MELSAGDEEDDEYEDGEYGEALCPEQAGFISLIHFFNGIADRHLPMEIYGRVLTNTDDIASDCLENVRLGRDLLIDNYSIEHQKFTFIHHSGSRIESKLYKQSDWVWSPIIGANRPSIITQVKLKFNISSLPIWEENFRPESLE
jgi:hypothetical protein